MTKKKYICWFKDLNSENVALVGGKNASLGEMIHSLKDEGVSVPDGFATTAEAYWQFVEHNDLKEQIQSQIQVWKNKEKSLEKVGKAIRRLFYQAEFPQEIDRLIRQAYKKLSQKYDTEEVDIAARSSATAEDLPEASFAGQQETFLNVTGEEEVLEACRKCYASLFTNRAIAYREEKGFDHLQVALSVGIQKMIRSDVASAGVMFSIDTETGFPNAVIITAAWGLGENVVQGTVNPDQYTVFKPLLQPVETFHETSVQPIIGKTKGSKEKKMVYATEESSTTKNIKTSKKERQAFVLSDQEILQLAKWAVAIESHYGTPMDL
ncbi:phosphoenolpyruvate synthase [Stanieria sp. NIES-3757]|nr:phosphoenolpyruvate synthase [Stanieria sp. NIES-3757]